FGRGRSRALGHRPLACDWCGADVVEHGHRRDQRAASPARGALRLRDSLPRGVSTMTRVPRTARRGLSIGIAGALIAATAAVTSAHDTWLVPNGGTIAPPNDSADVAAVVQRFHAALAAGDSLAALELLSDDVVILESGGAETRADYR